MKQRDQPDVALDAPDEALLGYLQTLLDEIPEQPPAPPKAPLKPAGARQRKAPDTGNRPDSVVERPPRVAVAPEVAESPAQPVVKPAAVPADTGYRRPEWAGAVFQVMQFETAKTALSVPLVCLRGITRLEKSLTKLPGMPRWHLGIARVREEQIGIIDLAQLLVPGRSATQSETPRYVLVLEGGRWGVLCEGLGSVSGIQPEAVRWRREAANPPYIEGVISDSLIPLLSTRDLLAMIGRALGEPSA